MKLTSSLLALVSSSITLAAALNLSNSHWIWTNEISSSASGVHVPPGARAFRRLIPTPQGVTPVRAEILITTDDSYTLFINGNEIGTGDNFHVAQSYCVPLFSPCGTLVAVTGVNHHTAVNPAGVLAAIEITFSDGNTHTVVSNAAWKALNNTDIPADYNRFSFDDSSWPNAVVKGAYGSSPWGGVILPTNTSCGCSSANS